MIKQNQHYFNWINRLMDMAILYLSYLLAVWFYLTFLGHDGRNVAVYYAETNKLPLLLMSFFFIAVFQYAGIYDSKRFHSIGRELLQLFKCFSLCMAITVGAIFLFKISEFSRGVIIVYFCLAFFLLCLKRVLLRHILQTARKAGYNRKHMLVVGSGSLAEKYMDCIGSNPEYGCDCIGFIGANESAGTVNCLGAYDELERVLEQYNPDEVIIAIGVQEISRLNELINICEKSGIRTSVIPLYNDYLPASAAIDVIGNIRLINIRANRLDIYFNRFIKRLFDVFFSLFVICLTSPLLLIISACVRLSSPGPVLFRQERIGRDREPFIMYKFRSMRLNDESETAWSKSRDARVTGFGAFIRKYSLDELPQFFNVLKGDMSVVGPRPELPFFVEKYMDEIPRYMVKHQVKPGITGWAQVNGYRGDTSITKRIEHDLWYIENWSVALDVKILFMTVFGGMVNNEKNLFISGKQETSVR